MSMKLNDSSTNCIPCVRPSIIPPTILVNFPTNSCTVCFSATCSPYATLSNFPRAPYSGCSSYVLYYDKYCPITTLRNVRSAFTCPPYTTSTYRC